MVPAVFTKKCNHRSVHSMTKLPVSSTPTLKNWAIFNDLDDFVKRGGEPARMDAAAGLHGSEDSRQAGIGKRETGRGFRQLCGIRHGDSDFRLLQGGGVVHPSPVIPATMAARCRAWTCLLFQ